MQQIHNYNMHCRNLATFYFSVIVQLFDEKNDSSLNAIMIDDNLFYSLCWMIGKVGLHNIKRISGYIEGKKIECNPKIIECFTHSFQFKHDKMLV